MGVNRRQFLRRSAAALAGLSAPVIVGARHARPRVVVVGGGAGGATLAHFVAAAGKDAVDVTLIEANRTYQSCFFSNLYIGGFRSYESLGHGYDALAGEHDVTIVHGRAVAVDRDRKDVRLASGEAIPYDRLVLSPGIDYVAGSVPGWDITHQHQMPHAYKIGGAQARLLKAQVEGMREGGLYAMIAPPNPYRCPPAPYERVSMVAHILKQKNPTAKILIFDPKPHFSKQDLFQDGWDSWYPGMIEWLDASFTGPLQEVRPDAMEINVDGEVTRVDVCNVIPAMQAGAIVHQADLTNGEGWAPVVPTTMQSRLDEAIHILGDSAQQGDMPKSAFSANSQAKVAANAILGDLIGAARRPASFANTCWSLIAPEDGVKVGAFYQATPEKIAETERFISTVDEDATRRKQTWEESLGWYAGITSDMFARP